MSDIENIRKLSSSYVIWLILLPFIASFCYQFDGIFYWIFSNKRVEKCDDFFSVLLFINLNKFN